MKNKIENFKRLIIYNWIMISDFFYRKGQKKRMNKIFNDVSFLPRVDQQQIEIKPGFILSNNKWGYYKIGNESYEQYIYSDTLSTSWEFTTPIKNNGVIGYPEIFFGKSPFGGETTDTYLPIKIDNINDIICDYDVDMYIDKKKYNLTFDLWVTDNSEGTKSIKNEIMIWEDRNVARPFGKLIGNIDIDGEYKVYSGYMDRSSENLGTDGWMFTAFIRTDRRRKGSVDIKKFLNYMKSKNILDGNSYLSTIEFGNEVYNASGLTIVNNYSIMIK